MVGEETLSLKKNVWLWNHYATSMSVNRGGRHYWFAENLQKEGYEPVIFCANTFHSDREPIALDGNKYRMEVVGGIPFVYVKTTPYAGNGLDRLLNMGFFYKNLFSVAKAYVDKYGKPHVILASSVHPLTMVAGIKVARKLNVPCICEVRDLWPESLVAYGSISPQNPLTKLLYKGERWIYKNADAVIMTWPGGRDYIVEQGWDKEIDLDKIYHISNGVVVESFDTNSMDYPVDDPDLTATEYLNVVYAGSIRKVNNLGLLLDVAKIIRHKGHENIRFLIYGSGTEQEMLIQRCRDEEITNVIFKGRVDKMFIPSILKQAGVNILHNSSTSLDKYGQSQNKLFEYLAAGRCIVQTYTTGYSVLERYQCGICVSKQDSEEIANAVIKACTDSELNKRMGANARIAAMNYDFSGLTGDLISVIESLK